MEKELLQARLQICQMLDQIGTLQRQIAQLQGEKLQGELLALDAREAQPAPSGAPLN